MKAITAQICGFLFFSFTQIIEINMQGIHHSAVRALNKINGDTLKKYKENV